MNLNRTKIIQALINKYQFTNYLEIGVSTGSNFFPVRIKHKTAVDPAFKLNKKRRVFYGLFNSGSRSIYYEMESDLFFEEKGKELFHNNKIEIAFVDGMHEYDFALRDTENIMKYLSNNGIIVLHDCNPLTEAANVSFKEWRDRNFTGVWNGDVWKTVIHLRSFYKDINVFVVDCDEGVGIITRQHPEQSLDFSLQQVRALRYEDFDKNRESWLNLKSPQYFFDYFDIRP